MVWFSLGVLRLAGLGCYSRYLPKFLRWSNKALSFRLGFLSSSLDNAEQARDISSVKVTPSLSLCSSFILVALIGAPLSAGIFTQVLIVAGGVLSPSALSSVASVKAINLGLLEKAGCLGLFVC